MDIPNELYKNYLDITRLNAAHADETNNSLVSSISVIFTF